jgi:hypothetical protein
MKRCLALIALVFPAALFAEKTFDPIEVTADPEPTITPPPLSPMPGNGTPSGEYGGSGSGSVSPFPAAIRAECNALAGLLPPGGWCGMKPPAAGSVQARIELYGALGDAINRLYGTGAGSGAGIVRMDLALRNTVGEAHPVYSRWFRNLEGLASAFYVSNHALPGSASARNFATDARQTCVDLEVALTGSALRGFGPEATECFRASIVLYAEATNQPLDPDLDRTWADGLTIDLSARGVGGSIDVNTLINRMFPTPTSRAIAGDNSFIKLQDALRDSKRDCTNVRLQLKDRGCVAD